MYICPNNKLHGELVESKHSAGNYRCYKCEGFHCWHKDELKNKIKSKQTPDVSELNEINKQLIRKMYDKFGEEVLPFYFRIGEAGSIQDSFDQTRALQAFSVVDGSLTIKKEVQTITRNIMEEILKELELEYKTPFIWI